MKNRKISNISEILLGVWTGICFDGWLFLALESRETEATIIAVAGMVVPIVTAFMYYIITNVLQLRKKVKAKKQAEQFIKNWAKLKFEEDKVA